MSRNGFPVENKVGGTIQPALIGIFIFCNSQAWSNQPVLRLYTSCATKGCIPLYPIIFYET